MIGTSQETDPFILARGINYRTLFKRIHDAFVFDCYIEIGCRSCETLALSRSTTIGVDPFFKAEINFIQKKPAVYMMQMTADDFFASRFLEKNGLRLSLSFIDGMHLIDYVLTDFVNVERASAPDGAVLIHDCVPFSYIMTTRDLENLPSKAWTGDVWKIIPILREYRPDLTVDVLDCSPTGLAVVSGLDPGNTDLVAKRDEILTKYLEWELEDFGLDAYYDSARILNADIYWSETRVFGNAAGDSALEINPTRVTP